MEEIDLNFEEEEGKLLEIEAEGSPDQAREYFLTISEKLNKLSSKAEVDKFIYILLALRLISLSKVSDQEKAKFISQNIVELVKQNYADVKYWLRYTLLAYKEDVEISKGLVDVYINAISQSPGVIGNKDITITTGTVRPSIKNWIFDYNTIARTVAGHKRGIAEQTTYINQSSNSKLLNENERNQLLKVLRIYDWLRFEALPPVIIKSSVLNQTKINKIVSGVQSTPKLEKPAQDSSVDITKTSATLAAPPDKVGFKSEFDQRLAAAGVAHGASLSSLRARIVERTVAEEKAVTQKTPPLTPEEIKREVNTPELPAHQMERIVPKVAPRAVPTKPAQPIPASPAKVTFVAPKISLANITVVEDLKKLEVGNLREGELANQVRLIRNKVSSLAAANNLLPFYIVQALEQSPMFKAYLEHGTSRVGQGTKSTGLTQEEFEALADLRKELGRL